MTRRDLIARLAADDRLPLDAAELEALMATPLEFTGAAAGQVQVLVDRVDEITREYPQAAAYAPGAIL